jgi:hypothetical protein
MCAATYDELLCFAVLGDRNEDTIYSDLTGRFPVQSCEGMEYIFVAYVYKLNTILLRLMKSRETPAMIEAFISVYAHLEDNGHTLKLHVMDNECSRAIQELLTKKDTALQKVEAINHKVNAAEPEVKCAKYHIISSIATLDKSCPIQLWSIMLLQMEATLNMLRTSRHNSKLTAYT